MSRNTYTERGYLMTNVSNPSGSSSITLTRSQLFNMTLLVEGVMLIAGVGIALWRDAPFWGLSSVNTQTLLIGLAAALPPLVIVIGATESNTKIGERARADFGPVIEMFQNASLLDILFVSCMAGICEEALFRGALQIWAIDLWGLAAGLIIISIVFGFAHFLSWSYFVFATTIGAYLGLVYIWTDSLFAAMVAHAAYDFVALLYGKRFRHTWT